MKYAVEISSAIMICSTKFHEDWCRHPQVDKEEGIHRQDDDRISLLLFFFQNNGK
jgi:hypothetical protein